MEDLQLLAYSEFSDWLRDLQAVLAAIPIQGRPTMQPVLDRIEKRGRKWRAALLKRVNYEVSAAQKASDSPEDQQCGG